jgi:hypothetical protein
VKIISTEEVTKCDDCNLLKNKIEDLHSAFAKFTRGRDKLNILLGNQNGFSRNVFSDIFQKFMKKDF